MQKAIYLSVLALVVGALAVGISVSNIKVIETGNIGASEDGDSNFTNVVASGDVTVGDALTVTGEIQAQKIIEGGDITDASTTLTSALTLTAAQVCDSSHISVNSAAVAGTIADASIDITLPATSTLWADCLDTDGDSTEFTFYNASPTSASSTEFVAGTGCDLRIGTSSNAIANDTIEGLNGATIKIKRVDDALEDGGSIDCFVYITENKVD